MTNLLEVDATVEQGMLDISRVKLTTGQLAALVFFVATFVTTSITSIYQLSEVRKAQVASALVVSANSERITALERDKATREGIAVGLAMAKAAAATQGAK